MILLKSSYAAKILKYCCETVLYGYGADCEGGFKKFSYEDIVFFSVRDNQYLMARGGRIFYSDVSPDTMIPSSMCVELQKDPILHIHINDSCYGTVKQKVMRIDDETWRLLRVITDKTLRQYNRSFEEEILSWLCHDLLSERGVKLVTPVHHTIYNLGNLTLAGIGNSLILCSDGHLLYASIERYSKIPIDICTKIRMRNLRGIIMNDEGYCYVTEKVKYLAEKRLLLRSINKLLNALAK